MEGSPCRVDVLRVLVTNDDGIQSAGLVALAGVARERGHDTIVVAPNWDSSGASAAVTGITEGRDLLEERHDWPGWEHGAVLSVRATPAFISRSAFLGVFGERPDVVISGINRGANTGRAILHSGTVGAAFTAYHQGCPALAVSLAVVEPVTEPDGQRGAKPPNAEPLSAEPLSDGLGPHWLTAAIVAGRLLDWLVGEMRHVVLNCNVPNVPPSELRGLRVGRLAAVGAAQTAVVERSGELLPLTVGAGADSTPYGSGEITSPEAATDAALLRDGYAAVTAVVPVVEDTSVDLASALGPDVLGSPAPGPAEPAGPAGPAGPGR